MTKGLTGQLGKFVQRAGTGQTRLVLALRTREICGYYYIPYATESDTHNYAQLQ